MSTVKSDDAQLDPAIQRELDDAWDALDGGDLGAAARALASARAAAPDAPAVLETEVALATASGDHAAALDAYRRWSAADPDDPEPWIGSAEVHLEQGEAGEAARLLRKLLAGPELDIFAEADARHLLGAACAEKGDRRCMVKEWLAVLRLDAAGESPQPIVSPEQFERTAAAALEELPPDVLERLRNVPILVEDRPSQALVLEGLDPRTLGLFHGIAMPNQSVLGPGPETGLIHLFQRNLEREVDDEDELAEQIRITVLHETAHYFGASEDDMPRFGLN